MLISNPVVRRATKGGTLGLVLSLAAWLWAWPAVGQQTPRAVETVPGMPAVVDPANLYSETRTDKVSPTVAKALPRVYVPNLKSNDVYVIDPPTGKPGKAVAVDDPYNMYFSPDGRSAIVVAEALKRLDFRDPQTMALQSSIPVPQCAGINHADFSIDGKFAIFTCEFQGSLAKVDLVGGKVLGYLKLSKGGMPQDIRVSPDGKIFYVADMKADGIFVVDGDSFKEIGFIQTGKGTHGLYPSRDGTKLYVANRGSNHIHGKPHGKGSVSVVDFATRRIVANWPIPDGGSPDMGNVSADGKTLWLSGRYDNVVYAIDTTSGEVRKIPAGKEPHGLTVWPQPGRYSLGHTGNMR